MLQDHKGKPRKATRADAERMIRRSLANEIRSKAATVLLNRVILEAQDGPITDDLQQSIHRFLARNPE